MSGSDTAAMVPSKYDVIIDGHGYVFWNGLMQSLPFRNQRAAFSYSNTFLERTNVGSGYGDEQQAFWLTASQKDWSGGQGQRYFHLGDPTTQNKAWQIIQGDPVSTPGQVGVAAALQNLGNVGVSSTNLQLAGCRGIGAVATNAIEIAGPDSHLWGIGSSGATDNGAHGAGTVNQWGMCTDGVYVYIAGGTKLRKWNGSAFSDFSASTNVGSIAYLNNALYSCDGSSLYSYNTSGVQSSAIFTWRDATGSALPTQAAKVLPFGGDLIIMMPRVGERSSLWLYDGTAVSMIAEFPLGATVYDIAESNGVVYVSGVATKTVGGGSGTPGLYQTIWYYLNGTLDTLWSVVYDPGTIGPNPAIGQPLGVFGNALVFVDASLQALSQYNPPTGAINVLGTFADVNATGGTTSFIASSPNGLAAVMPKVLGGSAVHSTVNWYPKDSTFATTTTVTGSLVDFDNSLTKNFHGVRVDWEGSGTVDIKYQLDSLTGSFTTLKTGATSGVEYAFPANTTGHAVSIQVVLNNSGGTPVLKRWFLRASPLQPSFRRCQYVLDITGRADKGMESNPVPLRDGSYSTLTGSQMAANLIAAITSATPITVTDEFGTYTAVIEQGEGITELDDVRPGEYLAQLTVREV